MRGLKRHFQGILLYETCSTANLLPLAIFKKFFFETFFYRNFLSKTLVFLEKNLNFERFEKFYYFSHILRQICYNLMKKN